MEIPLLDTLRSVLQFRRFELNATTRRLASAANVADLRLLAKKRLPGGVFDYIDGAAEDEITRDANNEAFRRTEFKPRILRDVSVLDTTTTILGKPLPLPLILAPTGFTRIADPQGELAVARAADRANIPYTLSTMSTRTIEEVRAVSNGRLWFQVYVWKDRAMVHDMVKRAKAANYEALMLTVDTAVLGRRERDVRRGFSLPPKIGLETVIDGIMHPSWTWQFARSEPIKFATIAGSTSASDSGAVDGSSAVSLAEFTAKQFDQKLSWADVDWFRSIWEGPIIIKGIQTVADAQIAADIGMSCIALSNHGGRQLDTAPAIFDLIAPVADALQDRVELICDGGIRRGSDIVKAVAAGAQAAMSGRAYLYGLGAAGERGVDHVITMLNNDVHRVMSLLGATNISELNRDLLQFAPAGYRTTH